MQQGLERINHRTSSPLVALLCVRLWGWSRINEKGDTFLFVGSFVGSFPFFGVHTEESSIPTIHQLKNRSLFYSERFLYLSAETPLELSLHLQPNGIDVPALGAQMRQ